MDASEAKGVCCSITMNTDYVFLHANSHCTHNNTQATGIRLGIILQTIFSFITAVIIAFIASWELTFVLVFVFPVLASVTYLQLKFIAGRSAKNKKRQEASGQTAVESIENIRTVAGLGVEDRFYDEYVQLLKGPFKLV